MANLQALDAKYGLSVGSTLVLDSERNLRVENATVNTLTVLNGTFNINTVDALVKNNSIILNSGLEPGTITTLGTITGGSNYTPGNYKSIPLTVVSGTAGIGATADITVNSSGAVSAVTLVTGGINYGTNTVLSATAASLDSDTVPNGSGFQVTVSAVSAGLASLDAYVYAARGTTGADVALRWNETLDKWQLTNDGTNYYEILTTNSTVVATNATTSTNLAGGTAGSVPYQSGVGSTLFVAPGTAGQFFKSNGTNAPTWSSLSLADVADSAFKADAKAATTATLTATYANGTSGVGATLTNSGTKAALVIDGVNLSVGDRVLVKNQTTTFQNGIYVVTTVGSGVTNWVLTRSTDADTAAKLAGAHINVQSGSNNGGMLFDTNFKSTDSLGSTAVTFFVTADSSNKLSFFASTTSAELAGVISDETGSGALVFATSPTLVTPVLGVATATTLNTGGLILNNGSNTTEVTSLAAVTPAVINVNTVTTIDTFTVANYKYAKYIVRATQATTNKMCVTELLLLVDGSNVYLTEYGTVTNQTNNASWISFDATSNGTTLTLTAQVADASTNNVTVTMVKNVIA